MPIQLKFKTKKMKVGNSQAAVIPKPIAMLLDDDKEYEFRIQEVDSE